MLGLRVLGTCAISSLPAVRPAKTPGKLREQYYQALAELPRAASRADWLWRWAEVLNAVGEALPRRPELKPGHTVGERRLALLERGISIEQQAEQAGLHPDRIERSIRRARKRQSGQNVS